VEWKQVSPQPENSAADRHASNKDRQKMSTMVQANVLVDALPVELGHAAARGLELLEERLLLRVSLLGGRQPVLGVLHLQLQLQLVALLVAELLVHLLHVLHACHLLQLREGLVHGLQLLQALLRRPAADNR
jgi:hypothetical protein